MRAPHFLNSFEVTRMRREERPFRMDEEHPGRTVMRTYDYALIQKTAMFKLSNGGLMNRIFYKVCQYHVEAAGIAGKGVFGIHWCLRDPH